jgi:cell division protein FtsB
MAATRIRWDRLGRWALIGVFCLVCWLYVGPAASWVAAYRESGAKRQEVAALERQNAQLRSRQQELLNVRALEGEARRLGMVKAGEKAFVVEAPRR